MPPLSPMLLTRWPSCGSSTRPLVREDFLFFYYYYVVLRFEKINRYFLYIASLFFTRRSIINLSFLLLQLLFLLFFSRRGNNSWALFCDKLARGGAARKAKNSFDTHPPLSHTHSLTHTGHLIHAHCTINGTREGEG